MAFGLLGGEGGGWRVVSHDAKMRGAEQCARCRRMRRWPRRDLSSNRSSVAHAEALYPLLQDERLYTYIPQEPPLSVEALAARYQRLATRRSPDGRQVWLNWAARLHARQEYVGMFQATIDADRRRCWPI